MNHASDVDFYTRKISRLEEDNSSLLEELAKLRARLRTAEDFEIKYHILLKNSQTEITKLKREADKGQQTRREQLLSVRLRQAHQKWNREMEQTTAKLRKEGQQELQRVQEELEETSKKLGEWTGRAEEVDLFQFKIKKYEDDNRQLNEQLEENQRYYEQRKTDEINSIKTQLTAIFRDKLAAQRKKYQNAIEQLEGRVKSLEIEKDNHTATLQQTPHTETFSLKQLIQQKDRQQSAELQDIRRLLQSKNDQIRTLLLELGLTQQRHRQQLSSKRLQLEQVEDRLMQREKQHEVELYHLIERTTALKEQQTAELRAELHRINEDYAQQQTEWNDKHFHHDRELDNLKQKHDEQKRRLEMEKNQHKRRLSEMTIRAKQQSGEREMGDTQMLLNSLKDIDAREEQLNSYDNGVIFLERQFKKCQIKLEERSRAVSKLQKDLNDIRADAQHEITEVKQKARRDKKTHTERILQLEHELTDLNDQLRQRERQERKADRESLNSRLALQQQNRALKQLMEQMQRDYNRVIENKKGVESSYRQQKEKGLSSRGDVNVVRRQKWLELQKQKNQLHVVFREKEEQLKLKYEQQIDDLEFQNHRLKQQNQVTAKDNELLDNEVRRLEGLVESNKENNKHAEYNKKLATLNLEIALTQDIYESLVKAKSRSPLSEIVSSCKSMGQVDGHDPREQRHQNLLMSFNPAAITRHL